MWSETAACRGLRLRGRLTRAVLGCAVVVLSVACTTSRPQSSPSPTAPMSPSPSSAIATRPSTRTIKLSCADATSAIEPSRTGSNTVGGLTFEGVSGRDANVRGSRPSDVGLRVPDGPPLYFRKMPVYMGPKALATTVELPARSRGYLAWVPAAVWTGGGGQPIDLAPWLASRVVFEGCPDQTAAYLGGLLSTDPGMCLTLRVYQSAATTQRQEVHLGSTGQC